MSDPNLHTLRTSFDEIMERDVTLDVDACGLPCPLPLLRAKQNLRDMNGGELLRLSATDAGSVRDFHSFAEISGHQLEGFCEQEGKYIFLLRKS